MKEYYGIFQRDLLTDIEPFHLSSRPLRAVLELACTLFCFVFFSFLYLFRLLLLLFFLSELLKLV